MAEGDLQRVLSVLAASEARYLVVGGVAVVLHGYPRFTADLDLVIALDAENVRRIVTALSGLGYRPRAPVRAGELADATKRREWIEDKGMVVFSLWSPELPATEIDIFVEEPFPFDEAYSRATRADLGYATVTVACVDDLVDLKMRVPRAKDLEDVEALKEIANRRKSQNDSG